MAKSAPAWDAQIGKWYVEETTPTGWSRNYYNCEACATCYYDGTPCGLHVGCC